MTYYEAEIDAKPPTAREIELLRHVAKGMQNKEIARVLGIKESSVETHLNNLYRKIKVSNRTEATNWGRENGIV